MIDFDHEVAKLKSNVIKRVISEDLARYEALKLKCLANKLRRPLQLPVECAGAVDINVVKEDMRELTELYKSGLLKKKYYIRDNMKILALCETLGIEFPGDQTIADRINMKYITEAIDDSDDMLDSSEEDDFGDLPDDDDFNDGDELYHRFSDGTEIILWNNASEQSYGIGLAGRTSDEVSDIDILECLLEHRSEASDWLQIVTKRIEHALEYARTMLSYAEKEPVRVQSTLDHYREEIDACQLLLNIINGRAIIPPDPIDRADLDSILSAYAVFYEAFQEYGSVR